VWFCALPLRVVGFDGLSLSGGKRKTRLKALIYMSGQRGLPV